MNTNMLQPPLFNKLLLGLVAGDSFEQEGLSVFTPDFSFSKIVAMILILTKILYFQLKSQAQPDKNNPRSKVQN